MKEKEGYKGFYYAVFAVTAGLIVLLFVFHFVLFPRPQYGYGQFRAVVTYVNDGDTVRIDTGKTVRLLGIDAPELHHPDRPSERYAAEAKQTLSGMVMGKKCIFSYTAKRKYDVYGRVLAHINCGGVHINAEMVGSGAAYYYERSEDRLSLGLKKLEVEAKKRKAGVWFDGGNQ